MCTTEPGDERFVLLQPQKQSEVNNTVTMQAEDIKKLVERNSFFILRLYTRYMFCGINYLFFWLPYPQHCGLYR